jgi:hypothetical protein
MSATDASCFRFVQLDVPGRIGLDDGRYLVRPADGDPDDDDTVLVVQTMGAPTAGRRPPRKLRRPRTAAPEDPPPEVPITRLTVIPARTIDAGRLGSELDALRADADATEEAIAGGLREVNRVVRAHRIASQDPYGHEIGRLTPIAVRVGVGTGPELADGRWTQAFTVPAPERRQRRAEALRPQERLAELLSGREPIDVCETLLLRARADLDQSRPREAAIQLSQGLDALLAELPDRAGPGQEEDLATLRARRDSISAIASAAFRAEPPVEEVNELAETLRICERVLRRRQALRE